eukprot:scaffold13661_cov21-Tisochrysis_lutea.AAC.1
MAWWTFLSQHVAHLMHVRWLAGRCFLSMPSISAVGLFKRAFCVCVVKVCKRFHHMAMALPLVFALNAELFSPQHGSQNHELDPPKQNWKAICMLPANLSVCSQH